MASTTHPHAFHFERAVDSYWEASADPLGIETPPLDRRRGCDVAIIGAGFTGLSAALELPEQGVDVRVLEAGHVGWGASGRNGGFACIGSHKLSYGTMIRTYGLDATQAFYGAMTESVDLVRDNLDPSRHRRLGRQRWRGDARPSAQAASEELRDDQAFLKAHLRRGDRTPRRRGPEGSRPLGAANSMAG